MTIASYVVSRPRSAEALERFRSFAVPRLVARGGADRGEQIVYNPASPFHWYLKWGGVCRRRGQPIPSGYSAAIKASYVTFAGLGVALASWAARIPQVKSQLGLTASELGFLLLSLAAGSLLALPMAGPLVVRLGARTALRAATALAGAGLVVVAVGSPGHTAVVVAGLAAMGVAAGVWDVSMNVEGALVERRAGRSIMSRFHAWFGVGTVIGAILGVGMIAAGISVTADLITIALIVPAACWFASRHYIADDVEFEPTEQPAVRASSVWRERRTLLVGLMVLAFALAEGTGNDWISLSMVQGHATPAIVGTLTYSVFLATMTLGRWHGPSVLDRLGRTRTLRLLAAVAAAGLLLFTLTPWTAGAFVGVALWGLGASLGFPVGISAGADEPALAAPRVGAITSIGYVAFLGGPPLIGVVASWLGLPHALWVVIITLGPAAVVATAAAPLRQRSSETLPRAESTATV